MWIVIFLAFIWVTTTLLMFDPSMVKKIEKKNGDFVSLDSYEFDDRSKFKYYKSCISPYLSLNAFCLLHDAGSTAYEIVKNAEKKMIHTLALLDGRREVFSEIFLPSNFR